MTEYNGWTNYATWNVGLWVDNEYELYKSRCAMLESLDRPVTGDDVREFVNLWMGGTTPDLGNWEGGRIQDIDWAEIADAWEVERQEMES